MIYSLGGWESLGLRLGVLVIYSRDDLDRDLNADQVAFTIGQGQLNIHSDSRISRADFKQELILNVLTSGDRATSIDYGCTAISE